MCSGIMRRYEKICGATKNISDKFYKLGMLYAFSYRRNGLIDADFDF